MRYKMNSQSSYWTPRNLCLSTRTSVIELLWPVWTRKRTPRDWYKSVIASIKWKFGKYPILFKLFEGITRLFSAHAECTRQNQAGFRPVLGCIDLIFTLWRYPVMSKSKQNENTVTWLGLVVKVSNVRKHTWDLFSKQAEHDSHSHM